MRAVGYTSPGDVDVLSDVEIPDPAPGPRDLLVEVAAVSVNPVDTKVRASAGPDGEHPKVLGYDAVGTVREVGAEVTLFAPGDRVWYAGAIDRPGTDSELHVVDERIVGHAPSTLSDAEAAAMPLTTITAWELLFDRLGVPRGGGEGQTLLVVGGAGGVGSVLVQLAKQLTALRVVATASRPETQEWVSGLGADLVVDHHDLAAGLHDAGVGRVEVVASLTHTDTHFATLVDVLAPMGRIAAIDDPETLDVVPLKDKCGSFHWEFMFARPVFGTVDVQAQHDLLEEVAALVDEGRVRTTMTTRLSPIGAATLREAHESQESGRTIGKTVVEGWDR